MLVVLVTNSVLLHQCFLCEAFNNDPDVRFALVICFQPAGSCNQKARLLGDSLQFDFDIIRSYESDNERVRAIKAIEQADICIVGAEDHSLLKGIHRPFFRYSEHFNKKNHWYMCPKAYLRIPKLYWQYRKEQKGSYLIYCAFPITLNETSICVASIAITALDLVTFPKGTSETL